MRTLALLLLLGLALCSSRAFADGKRDLEDGIAFYENLDTDRALQRLNAASEATDLAALGRAKAFLYVGMLQFENGNKTEAQRAWQKAFELERGIQVPAGTSPKTIEAIETARSSAKAPPVDTKVTVTPDISAPGGPKLGPSTPKTDVVPPKTVKADPPTPPLPKATDPKVDPKKDPQLTTTTTPPKPPVEESSSAWLVWTGIGVAVAAGAVIAVVLIAGGGDCMEGGGCLTVTFE